MPVDNTASRFTTNESIRSVSTSVVAQFTYTGGLGVGGRTLEMQVQDVTADAATANNSYGIIVLSVTSVAQFLVNGVAQAITPGVTSFAIDGTEVYTIRTDINSVYFTSVSNSSGTTNQLTGSVAIVHRNYRMKLTVSGQAGARDIRFYGAPFGARGPNYTSLFLNPTSGPGSTAPLFALMEDSSTFALTGFQNSTGNDSAGAGPTYGITSSMESDRISGITTGWSMSFKAPVINISSGTVSTFANYHVVGATNVSPQYVFGLRTNGQFSIANSDNTLVFNSLSGGPLSYVETDLFTITSDLINVYFYRTVGTGGTTTLLAQGPYRPRETFFVILNVYRLPQNAVLSTVINQSSPARFTNIRFYQVGRMGPGGTNTDAFMLKGTSAGILQSYDGKDWIYANTSITNASKFAWNGNMWVVGQATNGDIDVAQTSSSGYLRMSPDGSLWVESNPNNPLGNNAGIGGVAWGNGLWVAVGTGSTASIATSTDGRNWTAVTDSLNILGRGRAVAWNGNVFIATGNSSAGNPTTNRTVGTVPSNTGVSGIQVVTSFDGLTWTANTVPNRMVVGRALACTRVGNTNITVLGGQGDSCMVTSADTGFSGFTWTDPTFATPAAGYPVTANVNSIDSTANTITIQSNSIALFNSITFTARPSGSNIVPWNVYHVSSIPNSTVGTSTIQISATNSTGTDSFSTFVLGGNSTVSGVQARIGIAGFNRRGCFDLAWNGLQWYAAGEGLPNTLGGGGTGTAIQGGAMVMTSTLADATSWSRALNASSAGPSLFQGVAWNGAVIPYAGNGAGGGNAIFSAPASSGAGYNVGGQPTGTGISYSISSRSILPFVPPQVTGSVGQTVTSVTQSHILRGETNGNITSSFDAVNTVSTFATNIFGNNNVGVGSIAWNGHTWLAGGRTATNQTGLTSYLAISQDGRNWTRSTSLPFGSELNGSTQGIVVAWCGVRWIAAFGGSNVPDCTIATSTDGLIWTGIPNTRALSNSDLGLNRPMGIGFDGINTVLINIGGGWRYALSRDNGLTWISLERPTTGGNWSYSNAVWNGRVWLIGGDVSVMMSSYDGVNWTNGPGVVSSTTGAPANQVNKVLWTGAQWVAVMNNTQNASRTVISTTSDPTGLTGWTSRHSATATNVHDVTWNGAVLVATAAPSGGGNGFFLISRNGGTSWTVFAGNNGIGRSIASRIVLPIVPSNQIHELSYQIATNSSTSGLVTQSSTLPAITYLNQSFATVAANASTTVSVVDPTIFLAGQSVYISAGNSGGAAVTPAGGYIVNNVNSQSRLVVTKDALGIAPTAGTGIPAVSSSNSVLTQVVQYAGQYPMYISPVAFFGSGQDGDLFISGSNPTLNRDTFYRNVAWGAGSSNFLQTQFCRLYVSGVLDLTNCPVRGIRGISSLAAPSGSSSTGGIATALPDVASSVGFGGCRGTNGGNGGTDVGFAPSGGNITRVGGLGMLGGRGGGGGFGGSGSGGGGFGGTNSNTGPDGKSILNHGYINQFTQYYNSGGTDQVVALYGGGGGTGGGGGGGGSGGSGGGGGGAGGYGGIPIIIYARTIIRPSTQRICIASEGQAGGAGAAGTAGGGGGGGGSGGGGGFIYLFYDNIIGSSVGNLQISAAGGDGGGGGGGGGAIGGQGGAPGQILVISNNTGVVTYNNLNRPAQGSNANVVSNSGQTGGTGGALTVNL